MRFKQVGNKRDSVFAIVKNAESTATIKAGQPVVLQMNGTDDGLAVVLPSSMAAATTIQFRYGVATTDIAPNQVGEACVFGVCPVMLSLQTRANTSGASSFSTAQTVALGEYLTVNTVNNFFSTVASTAAAASSDNQTLSIYNPAWGVIGQSLASAAGIATGTAETRTVITQSVKAYLRLM